MKSHIVIVVTTLAVWCSFAVPTVNNLKVTSVAPWGLALEYTVSGVMAGDTNVPTMVTTTGGYFAKSLTGDTTWANGTHRVYWNLAKDGITTTIANGMVSVGIPMYCVIDLSAGANAKSYPVSYILSEPLGGFDTTVYKTTKLVLKYLPNGKYKMQNSKWVELTQPFYFGLFEVTQKQWLLVTGSNPSKVKGDALPVEQISYDMIRGSRLGSYWPISNVVDVDSFLGKLRTRTGLVFDLPTEAQWEYACRAGTTTVYSYGNDANGDYMWYGANSGGPHNDVGTREPNPWGLYDLHGSVWEWCLDWYGDLSYGMEDPKGSSSGSTRVIRGGSWYFGANICTSFYRESCPPSGGAHDRGFRIVRILSN